MKLDLRGSCFILLVSILLIGCVQQRTGTPKRSRQIEDTQTNGPNQAKATTKIYEPSALNPEAGNEMPEATTTYVAPPNDSQSNPVLNPYECRFITTSSLGQELKFSQTTYSVESRKFASFGCAATDLMKCGAAKVDVRILSGESVYCTVGFEPGMSSSDREFPRSTVYLDESSDDHFAIGDCKIGEVCFEVRNVKVTRILQNTFRFEGMSSHKFWYFTIGTWKRSFRQERNEYETYFNRSIR